MWKKLPAVAQNLTVCCFFPFNLDWFNFTNPENHEWRQPTGQASGQWSSSCNHHRKNRSNTVPRQLFPNHDPRAHISQPIDLIPHSSLCLRLGLVDSAPLPVPVDGRPLACPQPSRCYRLLFADVYYNLIVITGSERLPPRGMPASGWEPKGNRWIGRKCDSALSCIHHHPSPRLRYTGAGGKPLS